MVPIISLESEINIFWLFISEGIFNLTLPFFVVTDMRGVNHGFRTACQHKTAQTMMYRLPYGVVKYRVKSVTCSLPLSTWAYPESLCPSLFFKWGLLLYTVITTTRFPLDFPKGEQLCEISMHALWDVFFNQLIFAFSGNEEKKERKWEHAWKVAELDFELLHKCARRSSAYSCTSKLLFSLKSASSFSST